MNRTSKFMDPKIKSGPITRIYLKLASFCDAIGASDIFSRFMICCIVLAAVVVGMETYPSLAKSKALAIIDTIITVFFTAELAIKFIAEGLSPWRYFVGRDWGWNLFDFLIVVICYIHTSFNPKQARLLRLFRVLRAAKLLNNLVQLRIIVMGLIDGMKSMCYILLLLCLVFYLFAIVGMILFSSNDPFYFGALHRTLITLFRISTVDGWIYIMYLNIWGCDKWPDVYVAPGTVGRDTVFWCSHPHGKDIAAFYFVSFMIIAALVMMSLVVGAIIMSMDSTMEEMLDEARSAKKTKQLKQGIATMAYYAVSPDTSLGFFPNENMRHSWVSIPGPFRPRNALASPKCSTSGAFNSVPRTSVEHLRSTHDKIAKLCTDAFCSNPKTPASKRHSKGFASQESDGTLQSPLTVICSTLVEAKTGLSTLRCSSFGKDGDPGRESSGFSSPESSSRGSWSFSSASADRQDSNGVLIKSSCSISQRTENTKKRSSIKKEKDRQQLQQLTLRAWSGLELQPAAKEDLPAAQLKTAHHSVHHFYEWLSAKCTTVADSRAFQRFTTTMILLAAVEIGVQTEITNLTHAQLRALEAIDATIAAIFALEVVIKLVAEGFQPWRYFACRWNCFDVLVVFISFLSLGNLVENNFFMVLRLIRLLRVLKLVRQLPKLQMIIEALLISFHSVAIIGVVIFLFTFVFANVGIIFFGLNDPVNFSSLHMAMLTLFRIASRSAWTESVYINAYGCSQFGYESYPWLCTHSQTQYLLSGVYHLTYFIMCSLVLLTLFIGVVTTNMEETSREMNRTEKIKKKIKNTMKKYKLDKHTVELYRKVFDLFDLDKDDHISKQELHLGFQAFRQDLTSHQRHILFKQINVCQSGEIDFSEFLEYVTQLKIKKEEEKQFNLTRRKSVLWLEAKRIINVSKSPRSQKVANMAKVCPAVEVQEQELSYTRTVACIDSLNSSTPKGFKSLRRLSKEAGRRFGFGDPILENWTEESNCIATEDSFRENTKTRLAAVLPIDMEGSIVRKSAPRKSASKQTLLVAVKTGT